jgi:two-component system, OmpR family, response regulator
MTSQWTGPKGLHVLIVEDHPDTAISLAALLRMDGHRVDLASTGLAALEQADALTPDVVLLDLGLPGLDGWEVASRLHLRPAGKRPLLVAITGHGLDADRRRSDQAGIDLHLVKPVDIEELQKLLRMFQAVLGGVTDSPEDAEWWALQHPPVSSRRAWRTKVTLAGQRRGRDSSRSPLTGSARWRT